MGADGFSVGDVGPSREHEITRTDLVRYAGASGDFNPMHHDEVVARDAGLPSVFGHGMLSAGLLASALCEYVGLSSIRQFNVRFTKQTWPGDQLTTQIVVTGRREDDSGSILELECRLVNQEGQDVVRGTAVASLRETVVR